MSDYQDNVFNETNDQQGDALSFDVPDEVSHDVSDQPKKKSSKNTKRVIRKANITPQAVEAVLAWRDRLESADDRTKNLAAELLNLKNTDESKFISALMDNDTVAMARKSISEAFELSRLSDMGFAVEVAKVDRTDRRDLWDLESKIDPELANVLTNGSNKLPVNDLYEEVNLLRRMQKESTIFKDTLDAVTDLLG